MIGRGLRVATYAFTQLLALGEAARLELEAAFIEAYERPALESHIVRSLALARGPLLVREIREEFIRVGQPDPTASAETVLSRLGELLCFVKVALTGGNLARSGGSRRCSCAAEATTVPREDGAWKSANRASPMITTRSVCRCALHDDGDCTNRRVTARTTRRRARCEELLDATH